MIILIRLLVIITMYILSLLYVYDNSQLSISAIYTTLITICFLLFINPCITKTRD